MTSNVQAIYELYIIIIIFIIIKWLRATCKLNAGSQLESNWTGDKFCVVSLAKFLADQSNSRFPVFPVPDIVGEGSAKTSKLKETQVGLFDDVFTFISSDCLADWAVRAYKCWFSSGGWVYRDPSVQITSRQLDRHQQQQQQQQLSVSFWSFIKTPSTSNNTIPQRQSHLSSLAFFSFISTIQQLICWSTLQKKRQANNTHHLPPGTEQQWRQQPVQQITGVNS